GTHSLTAVFTPDNPAAFTSSTSEAVSYVVNAAGKATTTRLTVAPKRAFQGLPVFLIANVKPRTAAGTTQFKDGSTALGTPVPVDGGTIFLIAPPLTTGTHSLSAVFTPANPATFAPSTSAPVALTVNTLFPLSWH